MIGDRLLPRPPSPPYLRQGSLCSIAILNGTLPGRRVDSLETIGNRPAGLRSVRQAYLVDDTAKPW